MEQVRIVKEMRVVPRKGDVDRNNLFACQRKGWLPSSPARGTWIEMVPEVMRSAWPGWSSPARGTWIEMELQVTVGVGAEVVPRKGDVDRNIMRQHICKNCGSRPPQGGRG